MKVITRKDYKSDEGQKNDGIDKVNRSGYIPPDVKYLQMVISGKTLELQRSIMYDYTEEDEQQEIRNKLINPKMSELEAIDIAKYYEKDIEKITSQKQHVAKLEKEYNELLKIEEIKTNAINEYRRKKYEERKKQK